METERKRRGSVAEELLVDGVFNGIFAGWGESRVVAVEYQSYEKVSVVADTTENPAAHQENSNVSGGKHAKLNTLLSVSIAGCDLMGSALYTAGTCFSNAGKFAPVGLFLVTCMLFLYRKVYSEVVTAFPVNGGCYNLMLNTTTKKMAGFVACLSILSYIATAILSAFDAVIYVSDVWEDMDIRLWSVIILLFFGAVTILGVQESSTVSCTMFCIHMFTLTLLIIWSFAYGIQDGFQTFQDNLKTELPPISTSTGTLLARRNVVAAIYFGYSSGLLGITGFETASNYVEDLESTKTFVKTVNWMWFLSGVYNPLIGLVSMFVIPMDRILAHPSDMLAEVAVELGGSNFRTFVSMDAGFVLCGGVLTALVGVSGLLSRLARDRVLPDFFAYTSARGTNYLGIISFVGISITLFLAIFDPADPKAIHDFGGVFAISFLSVLTAFAGGAVLLKLYRPHIARLVIAKWWFIIVSGLAVFAGLIGNIILTPDIFYLFLGYLGIFLSLVVYMFSRVEIFSYAIWIIRRIWMSDDWRLNELAKDQEIVSACLRQDKYDECEQISHMITDYQELRAAVRKSILLLDKAKHEGKEDSINSPAKDGSAGGFLDVEALGGESPKPVAAPKNRKFFRIDSLPSVLRRSLMGKSEREEEEGVGEFGLKRKKSLRSGFELVHTIDERLRNYTPIRYFDRNSSKSADEIQQLLSKPFVGPCLSFFMEALDELLTMPFIYLAKHSDPISLQLAVNYIEQNELTNVIYVLHFVDDRKAVTANHEYQRVLKARQEDPFPDPALLRSGASEPLKIPQHGFLLNLFMKQLQKEKTTIKRFTPATDERTGGETMLDTGIDDDKDSNATVQVESRFNLDAAFPTLPYESQQLLHNVAILDSFYTYKKIHAIVVRGGFFSPSSLDCVANYLGLRKNCMIMGVPDTQFPFPFSRLNGCRIAIPDADSDVRHNASAHLRTVLETVERQTKLYQEHVGEKHHSHHSPEKEKQ